MTKRKLEDEELTAEAELAAAIAAAKAAPADEEIDGLGSGTASLHWSVRPDGPAPKQYKIGQQPGEKPLVFAYLAIRGLGETQRLMLAEAGAEYELFAFPMGEDQAVALEWRKRSPNGLCPILSGLGVPRAAPLSQSRAQVHFLARRFGFVGETELDALRADNLFETVKDLGAKQSEIIGTADGTTSGAKGPILTASNIEKMLADMPDPTDHTAALNYGQIELLNRLLNCEEAAPGCVKRLSPALDAFRVAAAARPRIAAYLASSMRIPAIFSDLGQQGGYKYVAGPVKRSAFQQ